MKKLLLIAILMLALVVTAVACTGNQNPEETTAAAGEATTVAPETNAPETNAPETEAPEVPTEAPEVTTAAPEVPTEPETTVDDTPVTSAPVVTTEPVTEAPVDPADPVYVIDAAALAGATGTNAATVELNEAGYASFTATGGDPWVLIAGNIGAMPEYMAVRYRTNTAQTGEFFIGNGAGPEGGKSFVYNYNANGEWNLLIFHLPTVAPYMTDNTVGHIRFDFYNRGAEDGAFLDVEYVAFFNSAEYAQAYDFEMHKPANWNGSGIVTHQSFDELRIMAGAQKIGEFFAPGASNGWDYVATLNDFSADTLHYHGWVGVKGELGQFGYQIDYGTVIYDDAFTVEPEQAVINAAAGSGADTASRFGIMINLAGLDGTHTVRTLYKTPDGTAVLLCEFTLVLPEKPKDIKDTFEADVNANDVGTGLGASDLADYFTVELPLGSEGVVANGEGKMYSMTAISDMYADVNGKYFIQSNNLTSANGFMFVRGYKVVNSDEIIEKFDPAGGFYKINNYYEQDMAGQMGGAGIYARLEGGTLYIMVKYYNAESVTRVGNKIYSLAATGTELTMADDGEVVSILVDGKTYATIALSGSTTYADINEVQPKNGFAASAVVTLVDGKTETIENTLIAETCECQVGVVVRSGHFKFDTLKVGAYSAIEIPEMETEGPRENIALNKPVSSDNIENDTNIPSNATDGDEATRYGALPAGEAKMIVDLEAVYKLSSMKILFESASCEYEIAISVDGVNYTQIHKAAHHGATTLNLKDLNDAEARYIMFHRLPTDVHGSWFSIYEVYAYGEKVAEPEVPEDPSNEIKVSTTDTYTWVDVVEFTATATGNYTFNLPAGLGAFDVDACDAWPPVEGPYVDYNDNVDGASFTIGLTEGETTTFYIAHATKGEYVITYDFAEGEVGGDDEPEAPAETILNIGENTIAVTDEIIAEGGVAYALTVTEAGNYTFEGDFSAIILDADGNMVGRGMASLEAGTYTINLSTMVITEAGNYNVNVVYTAPDAE